MISYLLRFRRGITGCAVAVTALLNGGCDLLFPVGCAEQDESAAIDVTGLFRYSGVEAFAITGTIEFIQEGNTVSVVNTTTDGGGNRALKGVATLVGNTLDIDLIPVNGDTDYTASVFFVFNNSGSEFCVRYSDTNGDMGDLGNFTGTRTSIPAP